jgi:type VI secretion system secreted protein Hcp
MAIYMKLDKIKGGVETGSFKDTMELTHFSAGCSRALSQPTGSQQNRGKAAIEVDMVNVSKTWDGHSSAKLFESLAKGDMDIEATISFTNADKQTYLEVELTKVALAKYSISGAGGPDMDVPHEDLTLSFTAIKWTPYTIDSTNKANKGGMVKYDLTTVTTS